MLEYKSAVKRVVTSSNLLKLVVFSFYADTIPSASLAKSDILNVRYEVFGLGAFNIYYPPSCGIFAITLDHFMLFLRLKIEPLDCN
jgi:hypothetical protein